MTESHRDANEAAFLRGGGATGALIAKYDWASTSLGPLSTWPESLKRATALIVQTSLPMAILWGEDGVTIYNDVYSVLLGSQHPATLGSKARKTSPVADLADRAIRTGLAGRTLALRDVELTLNRSGKPEHGWFNVDCSPLLDDNGRPAGVLCIVVDNTARILAERKVAFELERLRCTQQRLSAAVAVARLGTFEWSLDTGEATLDDLAHEIYGFQPDERPTASDVVARIDSDDLARLTMEGRASLAAGGTRRKSEYRIHIPDGAVRSILTVSDTLPGPTGEMQRIIGVSVDVTDRRRAESRQRLLINELNHRVKNTLTTVQSLARQTLRSIPEPAKASEAFESRLMALSAAHDLLNRESWHGARLGDLAASIVVPFERTDRPQISRTGPSVWLKPQRALALGMALHELATNAAKYGALSCPEGRVAIRWSVCNDEEELILSWSEEGGPPVTPPLRSGFGSMLLQRSLARELGAAVDLIFAREGVRCEIRCKLDAAQPAPAFDVVGI